MAEAVVGLNYSAKFSIAGNVEALQIDSTILEHCNNLLVKKLKMSYFYPLIA